MKSFIIVATVAGAAITTGLRSGGPRRSPGCHRAHTCPSDHATYRWRGLLCVSTASGESRSGYPRRVRYGGLVYYCKH